MLKLAHRLGLVAATLLVAVSVAGVASAQYREFTGRIDKVNKKKMIVDNRKGDKVSFIKVDETVVEGEGKKEWKQLKKGTWITVYWKFVDKPRKAYKIKVLPPKKEAGEDA